jgi:hypothetical protein
MANGLNCWEFVLSHWIWTTQQAPADHRRDCSTPSSKHTGVVFDSFSARLRPRLRLSSHQSSTAMRKIYKSEGASERSGHRPTVRAFEHCLVQYRSESLGHTPKYFAKRSPIAKFDTNRMQQILRLISYNLLFLPSINVRDTDTNTSSTHTQ